MANSTIRDCVKMNILIWWLGWLSLALVEAGLRFTLSPPPLIAMISFTLFMYSLTGIIAGALFGVLSIFFQPLLRRLHGLYSPIEFSMAASMGTTVFLYALVFFIRVGLYENTPAAFLKSVLFFGMGAAVLFLLPFLLRWMSRRGNIMITYLSLLPPFWIMTSLKLNRDKELLPRGLQVTTVFDHLLLVLFVVLFFFLLYGLISFVGRLLARWGGASLLGRCLMVLPVLLLLFFLFLFSRDGDKLKNEKTIRKTPADKPNIVLITLDTVRADHLSCYGYRRLTTPSLDRFSQEGVLFKNAYAPSPWTLPSHASLFTGMYPTRHGAYFSPTEDKNFSSTVREKGDAGSDNPFGYYILRLSEANKTLAEVLAENGYKTAGIIGGPFTGSVFGLAQGFDYYDEKFIDAEKDIKLSLIYQAVDLFSSLKDFITQHGYSGEKRLAFHRNTAAFRWLDKNHDQPFFLFINYFDAHNPYLPPRSYRWYFGKKDKDSVVKNRHSGTDMSYCAAEADLISSVVNGKHHLTPEEKDFVVSLYDGEIRYLDDCLSLLFERLKALKVYDNTLIIVTSDHGEAFGEHNLMAHSKTLYEELLRVPLVMKYPSGSLQQRGVIERRVSLVDVMPTIVSFLGYSIPPIIDGEPLTAVERPIIAEWHAK